MSTIQSYNAIINRFSAFAGGHYILKQFSHGMIASADLEKFSVYPFMHVIPPNVSYEEGLKRMNFEIIFADLPRDKEDKTDYQKEALSDLQKIAEDLIAVITNNDILFGSLISCENANITPFLEEYKHTLTGWKLQFDLIVPYLWDACDVPAEWNTFVTSSQNGTSSSLQFIESLNLDSNGNVSLDNDEESPMPNMYYGTDSEGVKGWQLLNSGGLTCEDLPACQTIIDIEANIDAIESDVADLQTEVGLKANSADISAVGYSNNYNDLSNLPTIPPAQVNADWNATSGVAEILNKPNLSGYGDMFKSVYDTDDDGIVDNAEKITIIVRNSTGTTLTKGQIVYLSGATGNRPNAILAQANTEATSSKTIGMIIADIPNNTDGQVAVNGTLHDLDTSTFTAGDTLWLSATTAGGMVANTPPAEPNHSVFIGYVARSHPNLGRIVLAIQNGYELDELHGVKITNPVNKDNFQYNASTGLWENRPNLWSTAIDGTSITGTIAITLSQSVLIPANTFQVGDVIRIRNRWRKNTALANHTMYVMVNTSNVASGFVVGSLTTNNRYAQTKKELYIKSATSTEFMSSAGAVTDDFILSGGAVTQNINWSVNQYIIFAGALTNTTETILSSGYTIERL